MLEFQGLATEVKERFKNNNIDDVVMDSLFIGVELGKSAQKNKKSFSDILDLVGGLRVLVDAQVYTNENLFSIYNSATFQNEDLKDLCRKMESQMFKSGYNQNSQVNSQLRQPSYLQQPQQGQGNSFLLQQSQYNQSQQNYPQESVVFVKQQSSQQQNRQPNYQFKSYYQQDSRIYASQIYSKLDKDMDLKSLELAKQLQNQFDNEQQMAEFHKQQQLMEDQSRIRKLNEDEKKNQVECQICLEVIPFDEMATLYCSHIYHTKCLNQFCTTQIQSRQFPLICPSVGCKKAMIYTDLSEVLDDRNLQDFQQYTFKNYVESHGDEYSWCPTPDCQYIFVSGGNPFLECPICKKSYCLDCKIEYHTGMDCAGYKEKLAREKREKNEQVLDKQFLSFVRGSKFKQCPKCKFWVEKSEGCNHMTCRCKFEFCYFCGGVYQKCACAAAAHAVQSRRRN